MSSQRRSVNGPADGPKYIHGNRNRNWQPSKASPHTLEFPAVTFSVDNTSNDSSVSEAMDNLGVRLADIIEEINDKFRNMRVNGFTGFKNSILSSLILMVNKITGRKDQWIALDGDNGSAYTEDEIIDDRIEEYDVPRSYSAEEIEDYLSDRIMSDGDMKLLFYLNNNFGDLDESVRDYAVNNRNIVDSGSRIVNDRGQQLFGVTGLDEYDQNMMMIHSSRVEKNGVVYVKGLYDENNGDMIGVSIKSGDPDIPDVVYNDRAEYYRFDGKEIMVNDGYDIRLYRKEINEYENEVQYPQLKTSGVEEKYIVDKKMYSIPRKMITAPGGSSVGGVKNDSDGEMESYYDVEAVPGEGLVVWGYHTTITPQGKQTVTTRSRVDDSDLDDLKYVDTIDLSQKDDSLSFHGATQDRLLSSKTRLNMSRLERNSENGVTTILNSSGHVMKMEKNASLLGDKVKVKYPYSNITGRERKVVVGDSIVSAPMSYRVPAGQETVDGFVNNNSSDVECYYDVYDYLDESNNKHSFLVNNAMSVVDGEVKYTRRVSRMNYNYENGSLEYSLVEHSDVDVSDVVNASGVDISGFRLDNSMHDF